MVDQAKLSMSADFISAIIEADKVTKKFNELHKAEVGIVNANVKLVRAFAMTVPVVKSVTTEISKGVSVTRKYNDLGILTGTIIKNNTAKLRAQTDALARNNIEKAKTAALAQMATREVGTRQQVKAIDKSLAKDETARIRTATAANKQRQAISAQIYTSMKRDEANYNKQFETNIKNRMALTTRNRQVAAQIYGAMRKDEISRQKNLQKTNKGVKEMTISWRGLLRIVGIQLAHRAISALMRAMAEGARQAIEYEKRISEIRTISQEAQLSTNAWSEGLRELSDSWGLDLLDQAEGAYQTLSNQVAKGAKVLDFMSEANRFAVTTVSSTADSVNLLTAAINAYHLDSTDANKVAAQFFKTIELGRVRASEMANSMGDILVMGKQLNIKLHEVQGAISAMTIQGIKYNKAATQLRGIFIKLLKPTKAMKEFFKELGVESGEAAIKTFGFARFLQLLQEKTKGSSSELAKYISRIRGLSGALAFTGKGFDILVDDIAKVEKAQASYARATELVMKNPGKKIEIEIQKIKNYFVEGFGRDFIKWLVVVNTHFASLSGTVKTTTTILTTLAGPAILLGLTALLGASKKLAVLWAKHPIGIIITATAIAAGLAKDALNRWAEASEKQIKKIEKAYKDMVEAIKKDVEKQFRPLNKSIKGQAQIIDQVIADIRARHYTLTSDLIANSKKTTAGLKELQTDALGYLKDNLKAVQSQIKSAENDIKKLISLGKTLRQQLKDVQLQHILDSSISPQAKIDELTGRIKKEKVIISGTKDIKIIEEAYKRIHGFLTKIKSIQKDVQDSNKEGAIKELERRTKLEKIEIKITKLRRQIRVQPKGSEERKELENALTLEILKRGKLVEQLSKGQQIEISITDVYKQRIALIKEQIALFEKMRVEREKDLANQKKAEEEQKKALDNIAKLFKSVLKFDIKDILKAEDPKILLEKRRKVLDELDGLTQRHLASDFESRLKLIQKISQRRIELIKIEEGIAREENIKTKQKEHDALVKEHKKRAELMKKDAIKSEEDLRTHIFSLGESIKMWTGKYKGSPAGVEGAQIDYGEPELIEKIGQAYTKFKASPTQKLANIVKELLIQLQQTRKVTGSVDFIKKINTAIDNLVKRQINIEEAKKEITRRIKVQKSEEARYKEMFELNKKQNEGTDKLNKYMPPLIERMGNLTQALQNLAEQMSPVIPKDKTPFANVPEPAITKAAGGYIPRGTDTVPAMLTPGEFVMNAASTKRFLPQLLNMNSDPSYYAKGGLVQNSVGDINVTVQGGGTSSQTIREIATGLRRGIKRGQFNLG